MEEKHYPVRMCSACRERKLKKDLIRVSKVKTDVGYEVVYDQTGKINARGAYICKKESCLNKAKKYKVSKEYFLAI